MDVPSAVICEPYV